MNSRFAAETFEPPLHLSEEFEEETGRRRAWPRAAKTHRPAQASRTTGQRRPPKQRPRPPIKVQPFPRPIIYPVWPFPQPEPAREPGGDGNSSGSAAPPPTSDNTPRQGSEHVRWVQTSLNTILNLNLPVDGVMTVETRSAIRSFQKRENLPVTGIVGPDTEQALLKAARGTTSSASADSNAGADKADSDQPASADSEFYEGEFNPTAITYAVDPSQPYGPKWKAQRPPGLPASARQAGRRDSALPYIEQIAGALFLGDVFVSTLKHLAQTESGARFGLPANIFDARPKEQRPAGKSLITAWGAFQFNRDAWRALSGVAATAFPWDCTPYEELARPITRYAQLFFEVRQAGGADLDAARGIRLWHRSPAAYRKYVSAGRSQGFAAAWQQVDASHRQPTDKHLRAAGLLQELAGNGEADFLGEEEVELAHEAAAFAEKSAYAGEAEFSFVQLPQTVYNLLRSGRETIAIKASIASGNRNENALTDMIFHQRHPERYGAGLSRSEPGYTELVSEWLNIRDTLVRPALRAPAPTPSSGGTMPAPTPTGAPDIVKVRGIQVARQIAPQIEALLAAATADGVRLSGGGFRTPDKQIELRRQHCGPTPYDIYEKPSDQCTPPTARPGSSLHERGLAIDFTYNGRLIESHSNAGFQWLAANAARFGLKNLPSEPWHWSINGR